MSEFLIKRRDQEGECQRLHFLLSDLREEKDKARAEKERVKAELEESRKTKQVPYIKYHFILQWQNRKNTNMNTAPCVVFQEAKKLKDAQGRKEQKLRIEAYKRRIQQKEDKKKFILVRELKYKVGIHLYQLGRLSNSKTAKRLSFGPYFVQVLNELPTIT